MLDMLCRTYLAGNMKMDGGHMEASIGGIAQMSRDCLLVEFPSFTEHLMLFLLHMNSMLS